MRRNQQKSGARFHPHLKSLHSLKNASPEGDKDKIPAQASIYKLAQENIHTEIKVTSRRQTPELALSTAKTPAFFKEGTTRSGGE